MSTYQPNPLVTVVIPLYNYAHTVERAIQSVKEQTLNNLSCVIVDDGSTDNSREVVERAIADDARFHYIYQVNSGVAEARNRGVFSEEAGGSPYVLCLDADDALAPGFLEACVTALENDPSIGIAYTGLYFILPDGREGLSSWPGEFNYDEQLLGKNQIPTCNVSRRVIWERLGGQRQRYAPEGAGEEDAEFWLRAGAYGFRAKKVTDAGLFIYSWQSGRVSGNRDHKMVDYRRWHPWTDGGYPPFVSLAKAANYSHPVFQYDEPLISVIIPVGEGHADLLVSALDSLEAQRFQKWEAVVVWDNNDDYAKILRTFPYIRLVDLRSSDKSHGAGWARNRGVENSRASLLFFLDADDWLDPRALDAFYSAWIDTGTVIYSDYVGKAVIDRFLAKQLSDEARLLEYNEKTGLSVISHKAFEYDCQLASEQPNQQMYIWSLVSILLPRELHDRIGGFDENMKSWEDWDYQIRIARTGTCFTHIPEKLVVYRFYSGRRREAGREFNADLVKYMRAKYDKEDTMGCNCPGKNQYVMPEVKRAYVPQATNMPQGGELVDDDFILIQYAHPNIGEHRVVGNATNTDYGFRGGGARFLVHKKDVELAPHLFIPVEAERKPDAKPEEKSEPVKEEVETPAAVRHNLPPPVRLPDEETIEIETGEPVASVERPLDPHPRARKPRASRVRPIAE